MRVTVQNITTWKASASLMAIALMLYASAGIALAAPQKGGGNGHPAAQAHAAQAHAPQAHAFQRAAMPQHVARPNISRPSTNFARQHFARPQAHSNAVSGLNRHNTRSNRTTTAHQFSTTTQSRTNRRSRTTANPALSNRTNSAISNRTNSALTSRATSFRHHAVGGADPASFVAHRHFAGDPAFRPFFGRGWHPYHHLGWIGPLFWPYAYGDFFYYALWPYDYEYVDPFWAYGYGDIYESIFSPYDYSGYVQGPGAPQRMTSLTQGMAESCADEAAEVTGWPINQIQDAVQPNQQQSALLDNLGNAIVKASDEIKSQCPTTVAFTPTDRLAQMRQRLQAMVGGVNLISPPLMKFYDSLSDEQKARFNDIAPPSPPQQSAQAGQNQPKSQPPGQPAGQADQPNVQAQCNANVMAFPAEQVDQSVHPNEAQRGKLQALQSALSQAANTIQAACPTDVSATPPARLAAIGKRLQAMLQGVESVQPALADFYNSLNDDQKARFNTMGKQLFAQNQE